jgi:RNA polymerase sigma-70 factor (ECF subfamily)
VNDTDRRARFTRLYEESSGRVFAYALRRCGHREEARDIVAETFAVAWRRIDDLPEGNERAWLLGVARRVLANHRRSRLRRRRLSDRLLSLAGDHRAPALPEPDSRHPAEVLAALRRLPARQQEVLRLAAWDELSHAEIAAVLGCSTNAAAIRLHRARRALQAAFLQELARRAAGDHGPGLPAPQPAGQPDRQPAPPAARPPDGRASVAVRGGPRP